LKKEGEGREAFEKGRKTEGSGKPGRIMGYCDRRERVVRNDPSGKRRDGAEDF